MVFSFHTERKTSLCTVLYSWITHAISSMESNPEMDASGREKMGGVSNYSSHLRIRNMPGPDTKEN